MPADRDDPPAEAVEAAGSWVRRKWDHNKYAAWLDTRSPNYGDAEHFIRLVFSSAHTLPAAARWRLIGWLAEGLEPTVRMCDAAEGAYMAEGDSSGDFYTMWQDALSTALTAAREASDE